MRTTASEESGHVLSTDPAAHGGTDPEDHEHLALVLRTTERLAGARMRSLSAHAREDLAATVVQKYFVTFGRRGRPHNLHAWLATALRTTAIDLHRAGERNPEVPIDPLPRPSADEAVTGPELALLLGEIPLERKPAYKVVAADLRAEVLGLISPQEADLVRWKYLERMTAEEIAGRTGKTVAATTKAVNRATQSLRTALDAHPELTNDLREAYPRLV